MNYCDQTKRIDKEILWMKKVRNRRQRQNNIKPPVFDRFGSKQKAQMMKLTHGLKSNRPVIRQLKILDAIFQENNELWSLVQVLWLLI